MPKQMLFWITNLMDVTSIDIKEKAVFLKVSNFFTVKCQNILHFWPHARLLQTRITTNGFASITTFYLGSRAIW
jgi:hypothetical protein